MRGGPRLLVLSYRYPFPPLKGDQVRLAYFLRKAKGHFRSLSVAYLEGPPGGFKKDGVRFVRLEKPSRPEALRAWVAKRGPLQTLMASSSQAQTWVARALREHEAVLAVTLRVAPLLPEGELIGVLDFIDALSLNMYERAFALPPVLRPLLRWEAAKLLTYEVQLLERFPKALVVSKRDWEHLGRHPKLKVVPNGVDLVRLEYSWKQEPSKTLVFLGRMDYPPNVDAAVFFVREIFPKILDRRPGVRFVIVGANPHPKVKALARERGVEVTGFVPDIRPYLARAAVFVAPLRWASGMQNKVLEAMAVGVPVVATPKVLAGFEQIEAGRHLLIGDTPESFAEAVLGLLDDPKTSLRISLEARELVEDYYDLERTVGLLVEEILT